MAEQTEDHEDLQRRLIAAGQDHLWLHRDGLPDQTRSHFTRQLADVDWSLVHQLIEQARRGELEDAAQVAAEAARAGPPRDLVRLPRNDAERTAWDEARLVGQGLLAAGKAAAIVVAGGQGTRLGVNYPKGMFPIGPVSGHSLFQIFCEQMQARGRRAGRMIPYCVMTSDATHEATVAYFEELQRFGLPADSVHFFRQGNLPAVDADTGRALLSGVGQLALSPDGHGGMLRAFVTSGLLDRLAQQGVETLFYHQVDNPTTQVCDPMFLGWHALHRAEVSTKVVAKRSAEEKMGVAVSVDGRSKIIEYSDLPAELAAQTDGDGNLLLWAGNTAIHAFQLDFLRRMAESGTAFPFHIARKAVTSCDETGRIVTPEQPNAFKFEQFIFDLLPLAERSLIVEADRAAEFNPVKNKDGNDSPETCRAAMQALHRRWLRGAGAIIGDDVPCEISPSFALDAEEVSRRVPAGTRFDQPTFLSTTHTS